MHLAAIATKRNDRKVALQWLARAAAAHPLSFDVQKEYGCQLLAAGRAAEAILPLIRASQRKSTDVETHINLGDAFARTGRAADALASYKRALAVDPNSGLGHRQLGFVLWDRSSPAEALTHLEKVGSGFSDDLDVLLVQGHCHTALGNFGRALATYQRAAKLYPRAAMAHLFVGS